MHAGRMVGGCIAHFDWKLSLLVDGRAEEFVRYGIYGPSGHKLLFIALAWE